MPIPRWWSGQIDQTDLSPNIALPSTVFAAASLLPSRIGLPFINKSGGTIAAGALLYVSGRDATSGLPSVSLAVNNVQGARAQWIAQAAVLNNAQGLMGLQFLLTLQNTNAGNVGDPVYLSATPGGYTLTKPGSAATTFAQEVGRITVKNASTGMINLEALQGSVPILFGANEMAPNLLADRPQVPFTIATTATTESPPIIVPKNGVIGGFRLSFLTALAINGTNFVTLSVNNRTTAKLLTQPAAGNNTNTGGTAISQYSPYILTVTATPADLACSANDVVTCTAVVTGTLGGVLAGTFSIGYIVN